MPDVTSALAGGTPWAAIGQAGIGAIQSVVGWIQAAKAQKKLQKMVNSYVPNQSIMSYYNTALSRYNTNPQDSALYKSQQQNINRNMANSLTGLNDRRSALAGLPSLLRSSNDASLNAEVAAENEKNQRFGVLGGATQMKAQEDFKPFELKYNLLSQKASGGNQIGNAGLSNLYGGLQNYQNMQSLNKMYK